MNNIKNMPDADFIFYNNNTKKEKKRKKDFDTMFWMHEFGIPCRLEAVKK